jgi:hypothetical protein
MYVNGLMTTLNAPGNAIPADVIIAGGHAPGSTSTGQEGLRLSSARLLQVRSSQISDSAMVTVRGGGGWDLNGFQETVGSLILEGQSGSQDGAGAAVWTGAGTLQLSGNITARKLEDPAFIPVVSGIWHCPPPSQFRLRRCARLPWRGVWAPWVRLVCFCKPTS